jgi:hypothetical protein
MNDAQLINYKYNEHFVSSEPQLGSQGFDPNKQSIGLNDIQDSHFKFFEDFVMLSEKWEERRLEQLASKAKARENDSRFTKLEAGGLNWSSNLPEGKDRLDILKSDLYKSYDVTLTPPTWKFKNSGITYQLISEGKDKLAHSQLYKFECADPDDGHALCSRILMENIVAEDMFLHKKWTTLSKFSDTRHISRNEITLLDDMYVTNEDLRKKYRTRSLGEILELILSKKLKSILKKDRPQLYCVRDGVRPNNEMYNRWNGLQVFDLDLKNSNNFDVSNKVQKDELKQSLYTHLCKYHWFVSIGYSSSGNGLHIYTKVQCPSYYYVEEEQIEELYKYWYRTSFCLKYAVIHYLLTEVCGVSNGIDTKKQVLDFAVGRISQGIRIAYDPKFLVNLNFEDMPIWAGAHIPPIDGLTLNDWLLKNDILTNRTFKGWQTETKHPVMNNEKQLSTQEKVYEEMNIKVSEVGDVTPYNGTIKYPLRYNVCNTLAHLFGEKGRDYAIVFYNQKKWVIFPK